MAWSTTPQGFFSPLVRRINSLSPFGDIWKGPQLATAKLDAGQGGGGTKERWRTTTSSAR